MFGFVCLVEIVSMAGNVWNILFHFFLLMYIGFACLGAYDKLWTQIICKRVNLYVTMCFDPILLLALLGKGDAIQS